MRIIDWTIRVIVVAFGIGLAIFLAVLLFSPGNPPPPVPGSRCTAGICLRTDLTVPGVTSTTPAAKVSSTPVPVPAKSAWLGESP